MRFLFNYNYCGQYCFAGIILQCLAPVGHIIIDAFQNKQSINQFPGNGEALDGTEDNMKLWTF